MHKKQFQGWMKHLDFLVLDLLSLHIGFIAAYMLKYSRIRLPYASMSYGVIAIIMTMVSFVSAIVFNTFRDVTHRGLFEEFVATIKQVLISLVAITLTLFTLQKGSLYSRIVIALTYMFYGALSYGTRILYKSIRFRSGHTTKSMLVITTRSEAEQLLDMLTNTKYVMHAVGINGVVIADADKVGGKIRNFDIVANSDSVIEYAKGQWVDEVFISLPLDYPNLKQLVSTFEEMGMTVHLNLESYTRIAGGHKEIEKIGTNMVLTSSISMSDPLQLFFKRIIDLVGGLVGVLLMCLLSIFVIPLQQIASPGPVFFKQERIGINGKRFKMYKFRSMCLDAEAKKAALMAQNRVSDGMMFKLDWDPRIIGNVQLPNGKRKTGIGEFIRRTSIDEFPQFLNVLKGDMSLVGTRPPTVDEWEKYSTHHRVRMATKPGITGMWQVSGRSEITNFEEVVELDRSYIENWSIGLDFKILVKTVIVVLKHKGAM